LFDSGWFDIFLVFVFFVFVFLVVLAIMTRLYEGGV